MRLVIVVVLVVLVSCKTKFTDKEVLSMNDMKTVMWDMSNADEWFNQISLKDSLHKTRTQNILLYEQVFASHNISKNKFYNSYQYYQTRPDKMKILLDSVAAYGERVRSSYKGPRKY